MRRRMRLCPNGPTETLRNTYGAIPLTIPESKVAPLTVFVSQSQNEIGSFFGEMKYLFTDSSQMILPEIQESDVSDVNITKTKSMDSEIGFTIMANFLKGFQINASPFSMGFKGVKKMSFSFENTKRHFVDSLQLGSLLRNKVVDVKNPMLRINDKTMLLVATSVFKSNQFNICIDEADEDFVKVGLPLIDQYVADTKIGVEVNKFTHKEIKVSGETPLAFAVSVIQIMFDPNTGELLFNTDAVASRGLKSSSQTAKESVLFLPKGNFMYALD